MDENHRQQEQVYIHHWEKEARIYSRLNFYEFKSLISITQFVLLSFLTLGNDFMSFVSINQFDLHSGIFEDFCPSHFFSQEKPVISTMVID